MASRIVACSKCIGTKKMTIYVPHDSHPHSVPCDQCDGEGTMVVLVPDGHENGDVVNVPAWRDQIEPAAGTTVYEFPGGEWASVESYGPYRSGTYLGGNRVRLA